MSEEMKLIGVSGGDMLGGGFAVSFGFGSHPCELATLTLRFNAGIGTKELAKALRDLADKMEGLKPEEEELGLHEKHLKFNVDSALKLAADKKKAWDRLLASVPKSYPPARPGGKKTRSRSVAPAPQPEKSMANKKTAKKRAKKMAKASKKPC